MNRNLDKRLCNAAQKGRIDRIERLLKLGADVNATARHGHNPLVTAAYAGHSDAVALLLNSGADINHVTGQGRTALHWAASNGHAEVVDLLIRHNAELNTIDEVGWSPLVPAIMNNRVEIAIALLDAGISPDHVAGGETMLQWASQYGCVAVATWIRVNQGKGNRER